MKVLHKKSETSLPLPFTSWTFVFKLPHPIIQTKTTFLNMLIYSLFLLSQIKSLKVCVWGRETVHKSKALHCTFELNLFFLSSSISCHLNAAMKPSRGLQECDYRRHVSQCKLFFFILKVILKHKFSLSENSSCYTSMFIHII